MHGFTGVPDLPDPSLHVRDAAVIIETTRLGVVADAGHRPEPHQVVRLATGPVERRPPSGPIIKAMPGELAPP